MPYLTITANGEEIDRRELTGPVTIGRAVDVDWQVRDILMSRRHCRIEPGENGWVAIDLGSKNGTFIGNYPLTRHALKNGDELRIGRVRLTFHAGAYVAAQSNKPKKAVVRPSDPTEAMAGTVSGFVLAEPGEVEYQRGSPVPRPKPLEPKSYQRDAAGMVNELASSSWDSIYAQATQPINGECAAKKAVIGAAPAIRPQNRVSFALQAEETTGNETTKRMQAGAPRTEPLLATPGRSWHLSRRERTIVVALTVTLVAIAVVVWLVASRFGMGVSAAAFQPRPVLSEAAPAKAQVPRETSAAKLKIWRGADEPGDWSSAEAAAPDDSDTIP